MELSPETEARLIWLGQLIQERVKYGYNDMPNWEDWQDAYEDGMSAHDAVYEDALAGSDCIEYS